MCSETVASQSGPWASLSTMTRSKRLSRGPESPVMTSRESLGLEDALGLVTPSTVAFVLSEVTCRHHIPCHYLVGRSFTHIICGA